MNAYLGEEDYLSIGEHHLFGPKTEFNFVKSIDVRNHITISNYNAFTYYIGFSIYQLEWPSVITRERTINT